MSVKKIGACVIGFLSAAAALLFALLCGKSKKLKSCKKSLEDEKAKNAKVNAVLRGVNYAREETKKNLEKIDNANRGDDFAACVDLLHKSATKKQ